MQRYAINEPDIVHETIDGETVVVNLASGNYYSLRGSAVAVWELVVAGVGPEDMVSALEREFDTNGADLAAELERFLTELVDQGLITATEDATSAPPDCGNNSPRPWVAPVLEAFEDMQDLLLIDPVHEVDERGWPNQPEPGEE